MGFGSYDESEQQDQEFGEDDQGEGVSVEENKHEGEVTFESEASADDLVDQLQDIKSEAEE
ncbi:MAG: DUF5786 family protein [Halobacteriaceae archaeon]